MNAETEIVPIPCKVCGKPVGLVMPAEGEYLREEIERIGRLYGTHNDCYDRHTEQARAAAIMVAHNRRMATWEVMCPKEFQKPLDPKAKGYMHKRLSAVRDWSFGPMGLRLIGSSGHCKTRFSWNLLFREYENGRKVAGITHAEFRSRISALTSADSAGATRFMDDLFKVDILLIDDLGKGRRTPASEEFFFSLIDRRSVACKPVIYTMNMSLEDFIKTLSDDYQIPLLRRIEDTTTLISF